MNLIQVLTMEKQTDKEKNSLHKRQTFNRRVLATKPLEQQKISFLIFPLTLKYFFTYFGSGFFHSLQNFLAFCHFFTR